MAFRVSLANATAKRTLKPLHERHQATPVSVTLDETDPVYSGMVVTMKGANTVRLCDGNADDAFGLAALDKNPIINDLDGQDMGLFAVWQGGPDAYFTVSAPAFDTDASYSLTDGESVPLYAGTSTKKGKLTSSSPSGNAQAIAQLIDVAADGSSITIRLLAPAATA